MLPLYSPDPFTPDEKIHDPSWGRALLLSLRDVFVASLVGMACGLSIDALLTVYPTETENQMALVFLCIMVQNLLNGVALFTFVRAYRVCCGAGPDRDIDAYLAYSTFITLLYYTQSRFALLIGQWSASFFVHDLS